MLLPPGLCPLHGVYPDALLPAAVGILGVASWCQQQKVLGEVDLVVSYRGRSRSVSAVLTTLRVIKEWYSNIACEGVTIMCSYIEVANYFSRRISTRDSSGIGYVPHLRYTSEIPRRSVEHCLTTCMMTSGGKLPLLCICKNAPKVEELLYQSSFPTVQFSARSLTRESQLPDA